MARLMMPAGANDVAIPGAGVEPRSYTRRRSRGIIWARAHRWGLLLVLGWLVQAGLRAWLSRHQSMPLSNPDETAYLIAARVLAGGPATNFSWSTLYQAGYPVLITPVYWLTSNPGTVYHAVLIINAVVSALVMPLSYLACRRLELDRPAAYVVAMAAGLVPAGFFYGQYAMADAIFPVVTLAWLLAVHSWLTAGTPWRRYGAAAVSAGLAGYSYAIHSRGLVILAGYAAVGAFLLWRQPAARASVAVAGLVAVVVTGMGWALNRHVAHALYPSGTRSLSAQMRDTFTSVNGVIHVFEMAAGQVWRVTLDSWGLAGLGMFVALAAIVRRDVRVDLRIMAGLSLALSVVIACTAPAALPPDQSQTWASGRYLDGMIVTFFLAGAALLLRGRTRAIAYASACTVALTLVAALTVVVYAGSGLPTEGFGYGFNFAEPAVLTQNWTTANVWLATAVGLALLAVWVGVALGVRRWGAQAVVGGAVGLGLAGVSLAALVLMTDHVSRAGTANAQAAAAYSIVTDGGMKPGDQVAVASDVSWYYWMPQSFEIYWTQLKSFHPATQSPPAGVNVVEMSWPSGKPARASWPNGPAGWRIVASNRDVGLVAWRKG